MLFCSPSLKFRARSNWSAWLAAFALLLATTSTTHAAKAAAITLSPATGSVINLLVGMAVNPGGFTVTASGGTAPYTFAVTAGAWPAGLTMASTGALTGTTTTAGPFSVTVTATDSLNATGTATYTGTVSPAIVMSPATLPQLVAGTAVNTTITATGGSGGITFSLPNGSSFANLSITAGGVLTGTPPSAGSYVVTVRATDSNGDKFNMDYGGAILSLLGGTLTISPATLPGLTVGVPFSQQLTAVSGAVNFRFAPDSVRPAAAGAIVQTWTMTTGTQIAGLTLSSTGLLSGTPTTAGPFSFGVSVTDTAGNGGAVTFSGTVSPAAVPTMPEWMLIMFAITLAGFVAFRLKPRAVSR